MNQHGIVHPGLLGALAPNHYASLCTIQTRTDTADSYGQLIPTWANLADHVSLRCRIAPFQQFSREQRTQSQLYAVHAWEVNIAGYYPAITEKMRAVIDSVAYDIELVQPDGQDETTHLQVRKVA